MTELGNKASGLINGVVVPISTPSDFVAKPDVALEGSK